MNEELQPNIFIKSRCSFILKIIYIIIYMIFILSPPTHRKNVHIFCFFKDLNAAFSFKEKQDKLQPYPQSFTPDPPAAVQRTRAIPTLTAAGCWNTSCPLLQWLKQKPSAAPCTNGTDLGSYILIWLHSLALYLLMVVPAVAVTVVLHVAHWHPLSTCTKCLPAVALV